MPWVGVAVAVVLSLGIAACTATILRRLPLPPDEPEALPYANLVSPRLVLTVLGCSFAALLGSFLLSPWWSWPVWAVAGTLAVLLAIVDAHTGLLPLRLTRLFGGLALVAAAASAWLAGNPAVLLVAVLCGAGAGLLFWLLWRIGGGLGFGDVRLAAVLGVVTGTNSLELTVWAFLLAGIAGVVWGVVVRLRRGAGPFPYGPALVLGPYLALLAQVGLRLAGLS
ncbi:MAG: A24 family peptidase [Propionicimonas sp.]|nr:A24 family peptidase [Propionicimonas sp.]